MQGYDYMPSTDEPLVKAFIEKFEGSFGVDAVSGYVFYMSNKKLPYEVPETKPQFFDMISQSIKQNKNLFLNFPLNYDFPEGAVI